MLNDYDIEIVARAMCTVLGLGPDQTVTVPAEMTMTLFEAMGSNAFGSMITVPAWMAYRARAAEALAAQRALYETGVR